jgi:hypothetical protein
LNEAMDSSQVAWSVLFLSSAWDCSLAMSAIIYSIRRVISSVGFFAAMFRAMAEMKVLPKWSLSISAKTVFVS